MNTLLSTIALSLAPLALIWITNNQLSRTHQSDIRVVWYFFSLSAVISFLLTLWARKSEAVDTHGEFHGQAGNVLSFLLQSSLDVKGSLLLCGAIVVVILLPQVLSYLFSGLAGCASAPIFVQESLSFFVWGLVKTLCVASGVILIVPSYAWLDSWKDWSFHQYLGTLLLSEMLIALAFSVLFLYRNMEGASSVLNRIYQHRAFQPLETIRQWMSRRVRQQ